MTTYIFNQLGVIPGIPGTFGNCRVDIDLHGTLTETPLALAAGEPVSEIASAEEEAHPVQETVQPEPVAPIVPPTPYSTSTSNGG